MDIATWLHDLGLSVYEQAFRENAIELELLPQLTADDLKEIGSSPSATAANCSTRSLRCAHPPCPRPMTHETRGCSPPHRTIRSGSVGR
jgi:hypothetical protein